MLRTVFRITLVLTLCCFGVGAAQPGTAPFPAKYREWVHVKSALVGPQSAFFQGSGGLHHIYANEQAMVGYRTGRFPAGSVIVFDLLDVTEKDGTTVEGARQRIDMMQKNSSGEWEFARFMKGVAEERVTDAALLTQCATCHARRKDNDFVFSTYRN